MIPIRTKVRAMAVRCSVFVTKGRPYCRSVLCCTTVRNRLTEPEALVAIVEYGGVRWKQGRLVNAFTLGPKAVVFASCLIVLLAASEAANGQNTLGPLVLGQPVTANGTGSTGQTASSSPIFVDATQFPGGPDVCAQISNAIHNGGNGGVVDARGFIGDQKCASNMFGSANPTGKLLLGNVVLHVQTPQIQPDRFQVEGVGWSPGSTGNTLILACNGDSHCTANLPTPGALWCWGAGGACSSSTNNGLSFGSLTQHMTFDCAGLSGCTAMQAYYVQEGSGCWHCQFRGWYNTGGIGLDVCDGTPSEWLLPEQQLFRSFCLAASHGGV